jgi:hypothetical protein
MALYEEAYGYTYLRILTQGFMIYLAAVLAVTVFRVWKEEINLLRLYVVISLVAYLTVNFINIDVVIARSNIERYRSTGSIDAEYLNGLSYEAVPILVTLLDDPDREVAAEINNGLYSKKQALQQEESWPSFNIAKHRARKVLAGYELHYYNLGPEGRLEGYCQQQRLPDFVYSGGLS